MRACTVPKGAPTESSNVAWACRSQCQFAPVKSSAWHAGLSWRLSRFRRLRGEPLRVEKTSAEGLTPGLRKDAKI